MERFFLVFTLIVATACGTSATPPSGSKSGDPTSVTSGETDDAEKPDDTSTQDAGVLDSASEVLDSGSEPLDSSVDASIEDSGTGASDTGIGDSGTDSGAIDAGSDTATDTSVPDCTTGTKCVDLKVFACVSGSWVEQSTCPYVCDNGACTGVCTPSDKRCNDKNLEVCDLNGQWEISTTCPYICSGTACAGSCVPDDKDCSGTTSRTCNNSGEWVNGSACPYVCSDGDCTGVCVPTTRQCDGLKSQTCSAQGQWETDQTCPYVCSGNGNCTGECVPTTKQCDGSTPQVCDGDGFWASGSACGYVCSQGDCTGVCVPETDRCEGKKSQTCNAQGQWATNQTCPYVCTGAGNCTGECVPESEDCQGDTPRSCNAQGQWISGSECPFVCLDGDCTGVCEPEDTQCSDEQIQDCNALGQWNTPVDCEAVDGAESYCETGECTYACKLDFDDCDSNPNNGCEADLNADPDNCGYCGHWCCGGACGDGTCEVYTSGIYPSLGPWPQIDSYDVSQTDIYWTTGTDLKKQSRSGGGTTTLVSGETNLRAVTVYESEVFWTSDSPSTRIYSLTTPEGISTFTSIANQLVVTSTDIFYAVGNRSVINYVLRSNNHVDSVMSGGLTNAYAEPIVTDGTYVYAARQMYSSNQTPIVRAPIHGDTEAVFVDYSPTIPTAAYSFRHLAIDDANLYYVFYIGAEPASNGIYKKPLAGGDAVQLLSSSTSYALATDGLNIYYANSPPGPDSIQKISVDGGSATTLHTGDNFRDIKVVDQCVYFYGNGVQAIAVEP